MVKVSWSNELPVCRCTGMGGGWAKQYIFYKENINYITCSDPPGRNHRHFPCVHLRTRHSRLTSSIIYTSQQADRIAQNLVLNNILLHILKVLHTIRVRERAALVINPGLHQELSECVYFSREKFRSVLLWRVSSVLSSLSLQLLVLLLKCATVFAAGTHCMHGNI